MIVAIERPIGHETLATEMPSYSPEDQLLVCPVVSRITQQDDLITSGDLGLRVDAANVVTAIEIETRRSLWRHRPISRWSRASTAVKLAPVGRKFEPMGLLAHTDLQRAHVEFISDALPPEGAAYWLSRYCAVRVSVSVLTAVYVDLSQLESASSLSDDAMRLWDQVIDAADMTGAGVGAVRSLYVKIAASVDRALLGKPPLWPEANESRLAQKVHELTDAERGLLKRSLEFLQLMSVGH